MHWLSSAVGLHTGSLSKDLNMHRQTYLHLRVHLKTFFFELTHQSTSISKSCIQACVRICVSSGTKYCGKSPSWVRPEIWGKKICVMNDVLPYVQIQQELKHRGSMNACKGSKKTQMNMNRGRWAPGSANYDEDATLNLKIKDSNEFHYCAEEEGRKEKTKTDRWKNKSNNWNCFEQLYDSSLYYLHSYCIHTATLHTQSVCVQQIFILLAREHVHWLFADNKHGPKTL